MASQNSLLNPLTPELNPSAQRCLSRFFTGILIFKCLIARRLYKSFDVKGLMSIFVTLILCVVQDRHVLWKAQRNVELKRNKVWF
jgi:hypothetical protein